jgi:C1A family cysteine protease
MLQTGYIPDLPSEKDWAYSRKKGLRIPDTVYIPTPPVQHQYAVGSCAWKALTLAMEDAQVLSGNKNWWYLSALFGYYQYRLRYADVDEDDGCYLRFCMELAREIGVCRESLWPYEDGSNWDVEPPEECLEEAKNHKIESYWRLDPIGVSKNMIIDNMLACMAEGYGFVGGVLVYDSFMSDYTERTGIISMPNPKVERLQGGHAVFFNGYDLNDEVFHGQNSWGPLWGKKGRFIIPFDYLTNFGQDYWTVRMVSNA